MILETDDDRLILIAAFRYALGRMSYMPSVVAETIIKQWNDFGAFDRSLFKDEIRFAIDTGTAGMKCDIDRWKQILELPDINQ